MGGMVVVHFALIHRGRVRGRVAADCGPSGLTGLLEVLSQAEQLATAGRMAEALENWLANPEFAAAREQPGVAARLQDMLSDYTSWRARHPGLRRGLQPAAAGRLAEISAPTLVIIGRRDLPRVQAASKALATGIRARAWWCCPASATCRIGRAQLCRRVVTCRSPNAGLACSGEQCLCTGRLQQPRAHEQGSPGAP